MDITRPTGPCRIPLPPIRFSLVDVPDLQVLPELWPSLRSVWMGAGPVPAIWHRALNALAWAVRVKLLPSLSPFAGLMHATMNFDPDDIDAAFAELDARYVAGEAAAHARTWSAITRVG